MSETLAAPLAKAYAKDTVLRPLMEDIFTLGT